MRIVSFMFMKIDILKRLKICPLAMYRLEVLKANIYTLYWNFDESV